MARRIASVDVQVPAAPHTEPRRPRPQRSPRPRLAVVHDTDGPRVRLGLGWFGAALVGIGIGHTAFALLMAASAALAAGQLVTVRVARDDANGGAAGDGAAVAQPSPRELVRFATWLAPPMRLPAALTGFSLPLAAAAGTATLTAAVAVAVPVIAVYRLTVPDQRNTLADLGAALAFGWATGLAAAAPVLAYGVGADVALVLIVLVAAYDAGNFIVGTGSTSPWEGPAAGIAAVLVFTFAATVVPPAPLDTGDIWLLGALACLLAPLGPPAASVLLGDGRVRAGFVRRLDSLIVLGPVWAYAAAAVA